MMHEKEDDLKKGLAIARWSLTGIAPWAGMVLITV